MADVQPTSDQYADEQWKTVVGYEGYYEVSDMGRVRSVDRTVVTSLGPRRYRGKILSIATDNNGTMYVQLYRDKKSKPKRVHVMVLESFVGPRPDGMVGCHYDDDHSNNSLNNLRWDTPSANEQDKIRNGNQHNMNKTHCPKGHPYVPENLYKDVWYVNGVRKQRRVCKTCHLARGRARDARKRASRSK